MMKSLKRRIVLVNWDETDINPLCPNNNDTTSSKKVIDRLKIDLDVTIDPLEVIKCFLK